MHLSYNGVTFDILTIDRADRRSVMTPDGADVLYTKWEVAATAVVAPRVDGGSGPGGTSVNFLSTFTRQSAEGGLAGTVGNGVGPSAGTNAPQVVEGPGRPYEVSINMPGDEFPILTDRDVRVRLAMPRRPLKIWGYDPNTGQEIVWLQSPRPGLNSDAKNGPIIRATPVLGIQGVGMSLAYGLEITTYEPPCPEGYDRYILGHRWQMTHEWDEDYYITRNVTGQIWFHTGIMEANGFRPDNITRQLFHPIPLGFKRRLGPVRFSSDKTSLLYSYSDTDQKIVFAPGLSGATEIELVERVSYVSPGRTSNVDEIQAKQWNDAGAWNRWLWRGNRAWDWVRNLF